MSQIYEFFRLHTTKVLGLAQGILAAIAAVPGVIPTADLAKWMAVLAVLTFLRGYLNSTTPAPKQ